MLPILAVTAMDDQSLQSPDLLLLSSAFLLTGFLVSTAAAFVRSRMKGLVLHHRDVPAVHAKRRPTILDLLCLTVAAALFFLYLRWVITSPDRYYSGTTYMYTLFSRHLAASFCFTLLTIQVVPIFLLTFGSARDSRRGWSTRILIVQLILIAIVIIWVLPWREWPRYFPAVFYGITTISIIFHASLLNWSGYRLSQPVSPSTSGISLRHP